MKTSNQFGLNSAPHWKTYTDFSGNIDLVAEGGTPCRLIRINATASGSIHLSDAQQTAMDAIPNLNAGDELRVIASQILASGTTNVTSVTVFW